MVQSTYRKNFLCKQVKLQLNDFSDCFVHFLSHNLNKELECNVAEFKVETTLKQNKTKQNMKTKKNKYYKSISFYFRKLHINGTKHFNKVFRWWLPDMLLCKRCYSQTTFLRQRQDKTNN